MIPGTHAPLPGCCCTVRWRLLRWQVLPLLGGRHVLLLLLRRLLLLLLLLGGGGVLLKFLLLVPGPLEARGFGRLSRGIGVRMVHAGRCHNVGPPEQEGGCCSCGAWSSRGAGR